MKKVILLFVAASLVSLPLFAGTERRAGALAAVRLITPGDNADLSGLKELEFRWSGEGDRSVMDHYDFRLYKGHETVEKGLILQKKVDPGTPSLKVSADLFELGETYAWAVKAVGSRKGRSVYTVFKVVKK